MNSDKRNDASITQDQGVEKEIPQIIMNRLNKTPMLPNESRSDVWHTFNCFARELQPETLQDYFTLAEVAVLTFEVMRYRLISAAIIRNQERAAVKALFCKMSEYGEVNRAAGLEAGENAVKWFSNETYRKQAAANFAKGGFTEDAIAVEAFSGALPSVVMIDKLIASAWRRLDKFLTDLTARKDRRAIVMRLIAERKISEATQRSDN
jgi:hypothetical protein